MGIPWTSSKTTEAPHCPAAMEKVKTLKFFPPYGSVNKTPTGDTCPTCRGTGRIPRGDSKKNQFFKDLYVFISIAFCLLLCCLILFFVFPRSVTINPVSVLSVMVYFNPQRVDMEVTNLINVTNENFVPVQILDFTVQGLVYGTVAGTKKISNLTSIQSRSQKSVTIRRFIIVCFFVCFSNYCRSSSKIHLVFLTLQMTMNISYLSHTEQVTVDTYEYIDCGKNSTTPHPMDFSCK
uniref:Transmembrane protein 106 C-terminal domain-containing protein n=1 Tax=Mola mola TaxID=94237 RepID=A0A3Q3VK53_MOLML